MRGHKCTAGCGKYITWNFAICSDCERIYGNKAKDWPEWLSDRWNAKQRERRRDAKIKKYEICITDLEESLEYPD